MGEIIIRKVRGLSLLAKISLVLVFTLMSSVFMYQGWYKPKKSEAVTVGTTTTMVRPTGGTGTTGPLTITNANWSCGAGTNRLLVIAVTGEGATGALNSFNVTATKGAGINFTPFVNTTGSRNAAYIGYLTESQIVASGTNSIVITAPGTSTGFDASVACYSNVDQENPIVATNTRDGETAATTTGNFSVAALNEGMVVFSGSYANTTTVYNGYTGSTLRTNSIGGGTNIYKTYAGDKPITATATESGAFTFASARFGLAVGSIRPQWDFKVGNGTPINNKNVGRSTTNNTLDGFTMQMNTGTGTVTSLTVTGSANFTSTNIGTNGVKVWLDEGTTVGSWDAGDTLISSASTAISGNATTVTISSASVTTTPRNYIVTVDILAGATLSQSFTGTVTGAGGTIGTTMSFADFTSATLTIATPNLQISNGMNPLDKTAQPSSVNNALDGFSMGTDASSSNTTVTSLTVTGSGNFTSANIPLNGVKVWRDTGTTVGLWDAGDTLISSASTTISGGSTTVTISSEPVTYPAKNYIVTVDLNSGATLSQSFTATVTGAGGSNLGTPTYNDSSSATLTINKLSGQSSSCGSCHGYAPYDATFRNPVSGAYVGSHQVTGHQVVCSTCHVVPATETSADFEHRNGNIEMKAGSTAISGGYYDKDGSAGYSAPADTTWAQTNSPSTAVCRNISCHGGNNPTPQWGVGSAGCVDCHSGSTSVTTFRSDVVAEFGQSWGHKKASRGTVTNADCIACHLEGNSSTQSPSGTYHMDGNIDLRDPDGSGETPITNISGGAFTFQKFSVSYAAGSRTTTGHTSNTDVANVITQKFCLACHDNNGATNSTARSVEGTQYMPFGGFNLGANYTTLAGAAAAGGLIDVKSQFATTNSSYHPVRGPKYKDYPRSTRLVSPYNNIGTARDSNTNTTGGTRAKTNSVVMNCFDCHTTGTSLTTRTTAAHGNASTLRGTVFVNSPTLCTACHAGTPNYLGSNQHGTGSAFGVGDANIGTSTTTCHNCHASSQTAPQRPVRAADFHGFNGMLATGGAWTYGSASGMRPIAFIRNTAWATTSPRPYTAPGITGTGAYCGGTAAIGICGSQGHNTYTPGGSY